MVFLVKKECVLIIYTNLLLLILTFIITLNVAGLRALIRAQCEVISPVNCALLYAGYFFGLADGLLDQVKLNSFAKCCRILSKGAKAWGVLSSS